MNNFKFKKNLKTFFSNIVFAYIAHAKFQKASFNSNRDIRQNIRGDGGGGGDGDGTQNNLIPPAVFQKRAGGKKANVMYTSHSNHPMIFDVLKAATQPTLC